MEFFDLKILFAEGSIAFSAKRIEPFILICSNGSLLCRGIMLYYKSPSDNRLKSVYGLFLFDMILLFALANGGIFEEILCPFAREEILIILFCLFVTLF